MTKAARDFDRQVFVSFQPDKRRGALQLARAFVAALTKLGPQEGPLVMQLDELVGASGGLVEAIPFLPSEPVALCLTGASDLVAGLATRIGTVPGVKFAKVRPPAPVPELRISAVVSNGKITLDPERELGAAGYAGLAKAGWRTAETDEDLESQLPMFEAEQWLADWGTRRPVASQAPMATRAASSRSGGARVTKAAAEVSRAKGKRSSVAARKGRVSRSRVSRS
jgi:hypothetical protein